MKKHSYTAVSFPAILALALSSTADAQTIRNGVRINPAGLNPGDGTNGIALTAKGGDFYCAWAEQLGTTTANEDIYIAKSTNDGLTFSAPQRIDLGDFNNQHDSDSVFIDVADNGNIVAIFEETRDAIAGGATLQADDIFFTVSTDGGFSWLPNPLPLNTNTAGGNILTDVDSPWMTVSGDTFHCVWEEDNLVGIGGKEAVYTRSTNGGLTWSNPVVVSANTGANIVNDISVVADGNTVIVAYVDSTLNEVFTARSTNGGASFGAPMLVESTVSGTSDDPAIEIMGNTVLIAWNEDDPVTGIEGVHCAVSQNGGATYTPEENIALQVLGVPGADADNVDVAIGSPMDLYLVYAEDSRDIAAGGLGGNAVNETQVAHSHDGGLTWIRDQPVEFGLHNKTPSVTVNNGVVIIAAESNSTLRMHASTNRGATWITPGFVLSGGVEVDLEDPGAAKFIASSPTTGTTLVAYFDSVNGGNEIFVGGINVNPAIGVPFCNPADPNSTGMPTFVAGFRSGTSTSGLHLEAVQGPPNQVGYFLVGTGSSDPGTPLSNGHLCLATGGGNAFGRYNVAGSQYNSVGVFNGSGVMQNVVGTSSVGSGYDVPSIVPIIGLPVITAGSTWHFQLWYRDSGAGVGTSNLSSGLSVTF